MLPNKCVQVAEVALFDGQCLANNWHLSNSHQCAMRKSMAPDNGATRGKQGLHTWSCPQVDNPSLRRTLKSQWQQWRWQQWQLQQHQQQPTTRPCQGQQWQLQPLQWQTIATTTMTIATTTTTTANTYLWQHWQRQQHPSQQTPSACSCEENQPFERLNINDTTSKQCNNLDNALSIRDQLPKHWYRFKQYIKHINSTPQTHPNTHTPYTPNTHNNNDVDT